jgi:enoyl-CoA hydratase/carnithine racemase
MNFADRVTITVENHVAHVLLDRADKLNALDDAMFGAIVDAGHALFDLAACAPSSCPARGGRSAPGWTWRAWATPIAGRRDRWSIAPTATNRAQEAAMVWRKLPMPVIAAVHGVCFGGGLQVASGPTSASSRPMRGWQ